jgi:G3E family GTPase
MAKDILPVAVLTGFLGAGKTSLLNTLLKDPLLANACVIINEFGDVALDHLLVEKSDDTVMELSSGCLCCTIRGELIDTMHDLLKRRDEGSLKAFDRIVIETTGLADPAPVLHTVMSEPMLLSRLRLQGVITVVDAANGMVTLDQHAEAVKQVAVADRIVLTKVDLLSGREGEDMLFAIIARLRKLNPAARLLTTHRNEATAERLFTMGLFDPSKKTPDVRNWLAAEAYATGEKRNRRRHDHDHHHHDHHHDVSRHDAHIRSFSFSEDRAISAQGLELFL